MNEAPWFRIAKALMGTKELPGLPSNPTILSWARELRIAYKDDSVPWCGLFMAHVMSEGAPGEPLPKHSLRARAWMDYGEAMPPILGAVAVFWRGTRTAATGHVGLLAARTPDGKAVQVLGGNQNDAVTLAWLPTYRLLGCRWPREAPLYLGDLPVLPRRQTISSNEA